MLLSLLSSELLNLVEAQVKLEASCRREAAQRPTERPCRPPANQTAFQTARLFLMHFGFLNPHDEAVKVITTCGVRITNCSDVLVHVWLIFRSAVKPAWISQSLK